MDKTEFLKFINIESKDKDNISIVERETIVPSVKELNSKSISFKNVDYEKVYEETQEIKDIIKRRKIRGFKFTFEKKNREESIF